MWTCPKCATKVDPSFDVCWKCGTTVDGVEDPTFVQCDPPPPSGSALELDLPRVDELAAELPAPIEGDLVEAYLAMDLMQAKFLADQLTEGGIPAIPDTHDMHDTLGSMSSLPRVWVRSVDLPRAKAWLDEYDRKFKAEHVEHDRH